MIKIKNRKERLFQLLVVVVFIFLGTTNSYADYSSIYFDARIDPSNHRLDIYPRERKMNGGVGYEDEYINEYSERPTDSSSYDHNILRTGDGYYNAMASTEGEGKSYKNEDGWINKSLDQFIKKYSARQKESASPVSKKNTIPAALYTYEEDGKTYGHKGLSSRSSRGKMLIDSICGSEDRNTGEVGLSMVDGFNSILKQIEILRDGYSDVTFKETLKGVTWLLSPKVKNASITFDMPKDVGSNKDVITEGETEEGGPNTTNPKGEDFVGNGNQIKVAVSNTSNYKKDVTISQLQENGKWLEVYKIRQIYRLETGYEVDGEIGIEGSAKIKITDKELNTGKIYDVSAPSTLRGLHKDDVKWICLYDLVFDAYVKMSDGITSDGSGAGSSDNFITRIVVGVLDDLIKFVESELGMDSIEDLVYGREEREYSSSKAKFLLGLFPEAWMGIVKNGLAVVSMVAILFLAFAVLRILFRMNLDSMNVSNRINLKEDIANVIYAVFGMLLFGVLFYALALFNYKIVSLMFSTLGNGGVDFTSLVNTNEGLIAQIILRVIMIYVTGYVNIVYIIRAMNISILLMLAPIFIIGAAFTGPERIKVLIKELVANIFLQSLHAILIVFIAQAKGAAAAHSFGGSNIFMSVVMVSSIIPVTNMFKDLVFGENKSLLSAGRIATDAKRTVSSLAQKGTTMAAGIVGGTIAAGGAVTRLAAADEFNKFAQFNQRRGAEHIENTIAKFRAGGSSSGGSVGSSSSGGSVGSSSSGGSVGSSSSGGSVGSPSSGGSVGSPSSGGSVSPNNSADDMSNNANTQDSTNVADNGNSNMNNKSKYYDETLTQGFTREARVGVEIANYVRNASNLMGVFSKKDRGKSIDAFVNGVQESRQMREYMKANKYEDRQKEMKDASDNNK